MPIKIDFISNVRDLLRGTKSVEDAFDDVADSLDDVVRDSDRSLEKLEDSFEDLGDTIDDVRRDGAESLGRLERTFRDVADASKDAGRDVGRNMDEGFEKAKRGADEFKDEANSTAKEAAASFDGSAESIGDAFQEVAANAFAGFGPLGAAAGIAAAAGLGVVSQTILGQQEAADELKARLADAYKTAAEEGRAYLDTAQIIAEASDLMFNTDRAAEWKRVQEDAKELGLDVYDVIAANAGAQDKQRLVQERINALIDASVEKNKYLPEQYRETADGPLKAMGERWREIIDATEEEAQKARSLSDVHKQAHEEQRQQIARTRAADQSRYEALADHINRIPSAKTVTIRYDTDESRLYAAQRRAEAWARRGLSVAVTGTLTGKGVWE
jgi:ABC-type transporter Mla subunit MlaD